MAFLRQKGFRLPDYWQSATRCGHATPTEDAHKRFKSTSSPALELPERHRIVVKNPPRQINGQLEV